MLRVSRSALCAARRPQNRLLREQGLNPIVLLLAEPGGLKGDAQINWQRLATSGEPDVVPDSAAWHQRFPNLQDATLLIDALFGTGLTQPLHDFFAEVVRDINEKFPQAQVIAVDLPSGVSADSGELIGECVQADASVTFTAPKLAHVFPPACQRVGEWVVKDIGTPREALEEDADLFLRLTRGEDLGWLAAPRKIDAHKGNFGHVLVLAGSVGKTGAAAMAAKGALRAGAGLVTVASAKSALPIIASLAMEIMTEPLPETEVGSISLRALDYGRLDQLVDGKDILAVGPGVGTARETTELVRTVVNRYPIPVVLDADGLNAFAGCMGSLDAGGRVRILTPHPGEMARLTGMKTAEILARRIDVAQEFARQHQVTLVLKGSRSLTAAPDGRVWVNPTGNPGMATGGTGDVLTGLIAGLLAQFPMRSPSEVVAAGVFMHGLAGDFAAREIGEPSLIAGDLLDYLPQAFRSL
jgi:hydroxyethylthiazole kinase-like uncharacterized protein yjeF